MIEKFNLNKMLEEIKEDEKTEVSKESKLSQDNIHKMMLEKLKKKKDNK